LRGAGESEDIRRRSAFARGGEVNKFTCGGKNRAPVPQAFHGKKKLGRKEGERKIRPGKGKFSDGLKGDVPLVLKGPNKQKT